LRNARLSVRHRKETWVERSLPGAARGPRHVAE